MAVKAVFFDVGETLVDETRAFEALADAAGVPRLTLMGVLGGTLARGQQHGDVFEVLGIDPPAWTRFILPAGKTVAVLIAGGFIVIALWAHFAGVRS